MRVNKRIGLGLLVFVVAAAFVTAQTTGTTGTNQELSVEESYLQESVELMVIREQTRADSRDMKMVALEYIDELIKGGRGGEEVFNSLEYLVLEGIVHKAREGGVGRIINNFPDVRAKAAEHLGSLNTEEAKDCLIKVVLAESEPMVLTEAIKSLAKIGMNENDETVTAISWIITRYDILSPDNMLALSALDAYEKIAEKNGGIKDISTIRAIMRIAEGSYIAPVRSRALEVLKNLKKYNGQNSNKT